MTFTIKLSGENYYLVQGPAGYAFARSKKRAVRFASREEAQAMTARLSGNVEVISI